MHCRQKQNAMRLIVALRDELLISDIEAILHLFKQRMRVAADGQFAECGSYFDMQSASDVFRYPTNGRDLNNDRAVDLPKAIFI